MAKPTTTKITKAARAKQQRLEGFTPKPIADIEDAAEDYEEARDFRMAASKVETEKNQVLIKMLKKHKKEQYAYKDSAGVPKIAELEVQEEKIKAKVRKSKVKKEDDGEKE